MPRALRVHFPGAFYHVTLRGNHKQGIFIDEGDQRLLNKIVARAIANADVRLHAYCWMSNHVHLLLQVNQQPLSAPMRTIACEFAREMQRKLGTTGHFFERRYHASLIDVDSYFLAVLRYVHMNPVQAGIVERVEQFAWSSHHAYIGSRTEPWVTTNFALAMLGPNRTSALQAYRRFLDCEEAANWTPDQMDDPKPFNGAVVSFEPRTAIRRADRCTLEELITEACRRFEVTIERLGSPVRDPYVSKVRAWIAHQAVNRQICGLSAVARALGRHESTLREAMSRYPRDLD